MGMIAFYAGLFIGILFGFLLFSLWPFLWQSLKAGRCPTKQRVFSGGLLEP